MGDSAPLTRPSAETAETVKPTTTPKPNQLFWGTFVHSKSLNQLEYLHDTAICVDSAGKIVAVDHYDTVDEAIETVKAKLGWEPGDVLVTRCREGQFFFPGFIDTHLHASQYPNVGIFGKSTLLDWLNMYTFPLEQSLSDRAKARRVYGRCVGKTLAHGTTTAAYYATIDVASTNLLADLCLAAGQRALVGRVCMDQNAPDWYRDESAEAAEKATRECIDHIRAVDPEARLVRPVLTPRFAPSCTAELMGRLGRLQRETGLPVQTHIAENADEIRLVHDLFDDKVEAPPGEERPSYAHVYDAFGLLGPQTILAHAVHLSEAEADLVGRRRAKISHCPCSNTSITSGAARVRWLLSRGLDVGLGTDMSGGYSPSILEAARQALLVSRHVAMGGDDDAKLSVDEVLFLATRGGARVVGLDDRVGAFKTGMDFDAQLVGLGLVDDHGHARGPGCEVGGETGGNQNDDGEGDGGNDGDDNGDDDGGNVDVFGWESWDERIAKWLFNGDDRNTKKVWVHGRLVHKRGGGAL